MTRGNICKLGGDGIDSLYDDSGNMDPLGVPNIQSPLQSAPKVGPGECQSKVQSNLEEEIKSLLSLLPSHDDKKSPFENQVQENKYYQVEPPLLF